MARVVIEIDGDSSGAEEALEDVQGALGDLDGAAGSAGDSFGGLNTKLVNVASGASLAKMGFDAVRGGINMLWESTERYFQSSEDGQEKWEALERQGRALKGMLFELFIGTNDQNEAFEEMSEFLGDLVAGARGAMQILQPMADLLRGGLQAGARAVAMAFGESGSVVGEFSDQIDAANDELERLQTLLDQQADTIGEAAVLIEHAGHGVSAAVLNHASEIEGTFNGWETVVTDSSIGFHEANLAFIEEAQNAIANARDLGDLEIPIEGVFTDEDGRRVVRSVDNLRDSLAGLEIMFHGHLQPAAEVLESQLAVLHAQIDAEADAANSAADANRNLASSIEDVSARKEMAERLVGKSDAAAELAKQEEENFARLHSLKEMMLHFDRLEANESARLLEEEMLRKDEAAKAEEGALIRMDALKDALDAKEATRSAKQQERVNIAKGGFQTLTNSAIGMAAAHIKAGKQSREETRKLIGDELVALGAAGLAKAAMMVFEPGKQALAAGLAVASLAAMGLGAKMGANSSGGSVAAPAATQAPQSQTNVTFQNNFSQIGSREQFLRVTGDTFQQAVDEGYIAIPRG